MPLFAILCNLPVVGITNNIFQQSACHCHCKSTMYMYCKEMYQGTSNILYWLHPDQFYNNGEMLFIIFEQWFFVVVSYSSFSCLLIKYPYEEDVVQFSVRHMLFGGGRVFTTIFMVFVVVIVVVIVMVVCKVNSLERASE